MISFLTLPDHSTHRHRWYGLTCEQYEDMLAACGQRCQICGCSSHESARTGKLAIDHDGGIGNWAVRGLLCTSCNAAIRRDREIPEWARDYIADPWYLRMLRELNLQPDPAEPNEGRVRVCGSRDAWTRRPEGWTDGHKMRVPHPWRQLLYRFGPHNITTWQPLEIRPREHAKRDNLDPIIRKQLARC